MMKKIFGQVIIPTLGIIILYNNCEYIDTINQYYINSTVIFTYGVNIKSDIQATNIIFYKKKIIFYIYVSKKMIFFLNIQKLHLKKKVKLTILAKHNVINSKLLCFIKFYFIFLFK